MGLNSSAVALIQQAATNRICLPETQYRLAVQKYNSDQLRTLVEIQNDLEICIQDEAFQNDILFGKTKDPQRCIERLRESSEWQLNSETAFEIGLIDEVVTKIPNFD